MKNGEEKKKQFRKAINKLKVHDHTCLIYNSREEEFAAVVPFISKGLELGQRCVYIADDNTVDEVIDILKKNGIKVDSALESGDLTLITKKDACLKQGYFDPDLMIAFIKETLNETKAAGYSVLRITGEMTWALGDDPGVERLVEYEAKLNYFIPKNDLIVLCQYNYRRFSSDIIQNIIETHPVVIFNYALVRNFYYIPPDEFLRTGHEKIKVERLLKNLKERELVDIQLKSLKDRLKIKFDRMPAGLIIWDKDLNVRRWNPEAERIFGYNKKEAIGGEVYRLIFQGKERSEMDKIWHRLLDGSKEVRSTNENITKDGRSIVCSWINVSLKDENKKVTGFLSMVRDITKEKKMIKELKQLNADLFDREARLKSQLDFITAHETSGIKKVFLEDLIDMGAFQKLQDAFAEACGVASVIIGLDGSMVTEPSNFCEVCNLIRKTEEGRRRCAVSDKHLGEMSAQGMLPEKHDCLSCGFTDASAPIIVGGKIIGYWFIGQSNIGKIDAGRICEYAEEIGADKEAMLKAFEKMPMITEEAFDKALELLWKLAGMISAQGYQNLILKKDLVKLKEKEQELETYKQNLEKLVNKRTKELQITNKELEMFSYSVSHDLRAPLRSMSGFSHLLVDKHGESLDLQARDYLYRINSASDRMGVLIDSLLRLSKISRKEIKKEKLNMSKIVEEEFFDLKSTAPERNAEIVVPPDIFAVGDKELVTIALQNLVGNAWKFSSRKIKAKIELGKERVEGETQYFIRDNGAGFDEKYKNKLFDAFHRLHSEDEFPGSGIGLATVKRIIVKHGGRIWAEGEPGKGAIFYFTLGNDNDE